MKRYDNSDTLDGINENTYKLLFGGREEIDNYTMMYDIPESYSLMFYTMIRDKLDLRNKTQYEMVNELCEEVIDSSIKIRPNYGNPHLKHHYKSDKYNFDFNKLTDVLECEKEEFEELHSLDRYGNCHFESINNCIVIPGSFLVTGSIKAGGVSILHSVTNYFTGDKEMCIDYTRNLVMPYEEYKRMHNFHELSRVSHESVVEDFGNGDSLIEKTGISLKTYCLFRDDIVAEIGKSLGKNEKKLRLVK